MTQRKPIVLVSGLFEELNTPTDKLDFAGNSTSDLSEGTNEYFTTARARSAISVTDSGGDGSLSYNSTSGVITYTGPSASEVRAHFSVATGSGLTYNSGTGEFGTNAIPNSQLANSSITLGSTSVSLGGTVTNISGLGTVESTVKFASDVIEAASFVRVGAAGAAGGVRLEDLFPGTLSAVTFEGSTADNFETSLTVVDPTADQTITLPDASGTVALLTSLSVTESGTGSGGLSYNNTTGVFTFTKVSSSDVRGEISVTDSGGDGSLSYNSGTGVITYTGPSASEVRAHFSVATGSGLTYNSGTGEFGTNAIPNAQLANSSITVGSTSIALGSSATTIAGLTSLTSNAIVTNDNGFRVRNATDTTKQVAFNLASVTTATTRTLTIPDLDGTILLDTSTLPTDFSDTAFRVSDDTDATKKLAFECSGITTGTTRTLTVPDASGTILLDTSALPSDFTDTAFRVSDDSDSTKKLAFECSGITTGTVRTMSVPDENGTLATQDFATAIAVALG